MLKHVSMKKVVLDCSTLHNLYSEYVFFFLSHRKNKKIRKRKKFQWRFSSAHTIMAYECLVRSQSGSIKLLKKKNSTHSKFVSVTSKVTHKEIYCKSKYHKGRRDKMSLGIMTINISSLLL